ncbi:MAG: hypothetical protein M1825_004838 [Sarcosagium campestre]|nr:MAG: hypothetical protein M1825_004838 [Sarcosagium campestre]
MTKKVARESLDVESFKRLMMTGDSSKRPPVTTKFPPTHTNLDVLTSSPEETGIAIQLLPATRIPLTEDSFEKSGEVPVSDDAYCQMAFDEDCSDERDKSLPPKARHIKLTQGIISHQHSPQRQRDKHALDHSSQDAQENDHGIPSPCDPISSNDLNKVLPNPPPSDHRDTYKLREHENTEGHDDIINAMISPSLQSDRRRPPTPPVARRHSQLSVRSSKSSRTDPLIDTLQRDVDHEDQRLPKVTGLAKPFRRHTSGNGKTSSSVSNLLGPSPVFGAVGTIPRDNTSSSDARSIPPAPPPARTPSSASSKRRSGNLSGASMDKSSMTSPSSMAQPPPLPPPRRHRTSSRSSLDSPVPSHAKRPMRVSSDGARILGSTIDLHSETQQAAVSSASKDPNDILADISALKREVDELRGKFEMEP